MRAHFITVLFRHSRPFVDDGTRLQLSYPFVAGFP